MATIKHGFARRGGKQHDLYGVWTSMKNRCSNPNVKNYDIYGGRGISVCERWRDNFENFLADMGDRPSKKHTLDRVNPDGNYEPGNCRWATLSEQAFNRRPFPHAKKVFYEGKPLAYLADQRGLNIGTVIARFRRGLRGEELFASDLRINNRFGRHR